MTLHFQTGDITLTVWRWFGAGNALTGFGSWSLASCSVASMYSKPSCAEQRSEMSQTVDVLPFVGHTLHQGSHLVPAASDLTGVISCHVTLAAHVMSLVQLVECDCVSLC